MTWMVYTFLVGFAWNYIPASMHEEPLRTRILLYIGILMTLVSVSSFIARMITQFLINYTG